MNDARLVGVSQPIGYLRRNPQCVTEPHAVTRNQRVQGPAGDVFHHDVVDAVFSREIVMTTMLG